MAWHKQIGYDERIMQKVEGKEADRQKYIFSMLTIMLVVVGLLVFFSSLVFMLVIFRNWSLAIFSGLFLALIVFNIYRFLIVSSVNASYSGLAEFQSKHEMAYLNYLNTDMDFSKMTQEQILHSVNKKKEELRSIFPLSGFHLTNRFTLFFTMLVRVSLIAIFAIVFATGIELFIFKGAINITLEETRLMLLEEAPNSWTLKEILTPIDGTDFIWFNCNSLLVLLSVLSHSLGYWKLVFDFIFLMIFLMPLILIFRSREILFGDYVRELALHEIAISHYHYMKTQKACSAIIQEIIEKNEQIVNQCKLHE
jgi:hypothetical protein